MLQTAFYTPIICYNWLFLSSRTCDPRADHAGEIFLADAKQQPDRPAHRDEDPNGKTGQEKKRHADVFLLACRPAPLRGFDALPVGAGARRGPALARPALGLDVGDVVFEVDGTVAGTIVRLLNACFSAFLAYGEDTFGKGRRAESLRYRKRGFGRGFGGGGRGQGVFGLGLSAVKDVVSGVGAVGRIGCRSCGF